MESVAGHLIATASVLALWVSIAALPVPDRLGSRTRIPGGQCRRRSPPSCGRPEAGSVVVDMAASGVDGARDGCLMRVSPESPSIAVGL